MRALALGCLLALGCKKIESAPPPPTRPAAITEPERKRGGEACTAYVEAACRCPGSDEPCRLAKSLPEALNLLLDLDADPASKLGDVQAAQAEARRIMATCIQEAQKGERPCAATGGGAPAGGAESAGGAGGAKASAGGAAAQPRYLPEPHPAAPSR